MIRKWYQIVAHQLLLLSAFSLALVPTNVSSYDVYSGQEMYYVNQDCCQDDCQERGLTKNWGCWIGGALLGAAAGAATGAAVSSGKHGSRGSTGDTGPIGPAGPPGTFPTDGTNTLTFSASTTIGAGLVGMELVFFVSMPDGTVLQTAPVTAVLGLLNFPDLVVSPAQFGEYATGIQISGNTLVGGPTPLLLEVVASRDASTTTFNVLLPPTIVGFVQRQSSVNFVYGDAPLP